MGGEEALWFAADVFHRGINKVIIALRWREGDSVGVWGSLG